MCQWFETKTFETKTFETKPPLLSSQTKVKYILCQGQPPTYHLFLEVNLPLPTIFQDQPPMCQFHLYNLCSQLTPQNLTFNLPPIFKVNLPHPLNCVVCGNTSHCLGYHGNKTKFRGHVYFILPQNLFLRRRN